MPIALSNPPIVVGIKQTSNAIKTGTENYRAGINAERLERDADQQKDKRQRREQNCQRNFVRRLLALRAFHQRNHPIEKAVALFHGDSNNNAVAQHACAAGDSAAVAAAFANDGSRFAGDGGFIDTGDAFDHVAVRRNDVARFANHDVALLQDRSPEPFPRGHCCRRRAIVVVSRIGARLAACALPRPSAIASAKFAKSTVNHSQIANCATKPRNAGSAVKMPTVVSAAPTMVTNMTGFLIISRGLSFLKASPIAGRTMFQSKRERPCVFIDCRSSIEFSSRGQEVFDHGTKSERRQKIQRTDQEHRADEENKERSPVNGKSAGARRRNLLLHQRTRQGHDRYDHQETAKQHVETEGGVVPRCVTRQSSEGAAIVSRT